MRTSGEDDMAGVCVWNCSHCKPVLCRSSRRMHESKCVICLLRVASRSYAVQHELFFPRCCSDYVENVTSTYSLSFWFFASHLLFVHINIWSCKSFALAVYRYHCTGKYLFTEIIVIRGAIYQWIRTTTTPATNNWNNGKKWWEKRSRKGELDPIFRRYDKKCVNTKTNKGWKSRKQTQQQQQKLVLHSGSGKLRNLVFNIASCHHKTFPFRFIFVRLLVQDFCFSRACLFAMPSHVVYVYADAPWCDVNYQDLTIA